MKLPIKAIMILVYSALFLVSAANSQTTSGAPTNKAINLSVSDNDSIKTTSFARRSHCCSMYGKSLPAAVKFSSLSGFSTDANPIKTARGLDGAAVGSTTDSGVAERRYCWHEGQTTATSEPQLTIGGGASSEPVEIICEETTLVGGFNTSVTDFNFLEITATGTKGTSVTDIKGLVLIRTTISNQVFQVPFTIAVGTNAAVRTDVSIHDAIGNIKDFGQVVVVHNAAPGQLKVKLTQYRIVTQSPLDFEPVLQEVFKTRTSRF